MEAALREIALPAACAIIAAVHSLLVYRLWTSLQSRDASREGARKAPLRPVASRPPPAARPAKEYDRSLRTLEEEQGAWYVNNILERELARLYQYYARASGPASGSDYDEDSEDCDCPCHDDPPDCDCEDGCDGDCDCPCHDDCDDDCECRCHDEDDTDSEDDSDDSDGGDDSNGGDDSVGEDVGGDEGGEDGTGIIDGDDGNSGDDGDGRDDGGENNEGAGIGGGAAPVADSPELATRENERKKQPGKRVPPLRAGDPGEPVARDAPGTPRDGPNSNPLAARQAVQRP